MFFWPHLFTCKMQLSAQCLSCVPFFGLLSNRPVWASCFGFCWASSYIHSELALYGAADGLSGPHLCVWRWAGAWLWHFSFPRGFSPSRVGEGCGSDSKGHSLLSPVLPLAGPLI